MPASILLIMNQPEAIYDSTRVDRATRFRRRLARTAGQQLRSWLETGLDLVFPPRCAGCLRVDVHWCAECQRLLDALPLPAPGDNPTTSFTAFATSGGHAGLLRKAILALKFENAPQLARPLGARLALLVARENWTPDLLVPVPLHPSRERERGYNQAQLVGQELAQLLDIPQEAGALQRVIATRAQVGLDRTQRQRNVAGAFAAGSELIGGRDVLLVDDVYTTGATLRECARALRAKGAAKVYGLTLSRATTTTQHGGGSTRWT